MGQQTVLDFLKKHPNKWFTAKEIAERLGLNDGCVRASLRRLRKDFVNYQKVMKEINRKNTEVYIYQYKK